MGGFAGAFYLLPDWTIEGFLAAMLAGVAFGSVIGALHGKWSRSPWVFLILCSGAGGIGGLAWSGVQSADWQDGAIIGVMVGFVLPGLEKFVQLIQKDDSTH